VITNPLENLGIPTQVKKRAKLENPLYYIKCDIKLDLLDVTNKKTDSVDFLKQLASETLNTKYPSEEWLRIYTDGSLTDEDGVGAGVYSELFSHYIAVGENKTVFERECQGILYALTQLLYRQNAYEKVVILVDSKSVIEAMSSKKTPKTQIVLEINKALHHLTALKYVTIQWVPSHVGIYGNEVADLLAKKGTLYKSNQTLEAHEAKTIIKK
jgi:ribonuclease HI